MCTPKPKGPSVQPIKTPATPAPPPAPEPTPSAPVVGDEALAKIAGDKTTSSKKKGTDALRIPLIPTTGGAGLNIPT